MILELITAVISIFNKFYPSETQQVLKKLNKEYEDNNNIIDANYR